MQKFYYNIPPECLDKIPGSEMIMECFRITRQSPPIQDDFCPQLFDPKARKHKDPCAICGISVFGDLESAVGCLEHFRKLGKYIYKGNVSSREQGPLEQISGSHYNWYQYKSSDPVTIFHEKRYEND